MCDENRNEKLVPSTMNLHERASEEHAEAKGNMDSTTKVVGEPLKPSVDGHHLPAAVEEVACCCLDTPMPSANVDVADSQRGSVKHNGESFEGAAPLDREFGVASGKDMDESDDDDDGDPWKPTSENVETSAPIDLEDGVIACKAMKVSDNREDPGEPTHENVDDLGNIRDLVEPICDRFTGAMEPIHGNFEGSVESLRESVEPSVDPMSETVEATISGYRKDEVGVDENGGTIELPWQENEVNDCDLAANHLQSGEPIVLTNVEDDDITQNKSVNAGNNQFAVQEELASHVEFCGDELKNDVAEAMRTDSLTVENGNSSFEHLFLDEYDEGSLSGTEEQQSSFMKVLEKFFRERNIEFKPPKFYGEGLNCLKLWRSVMRLGGYDKVTSCKLWKQVGEAFRPPKTCTTVSWTFRGFYEKALLDLEREKILEEQERPHIQAPSNAEPISVDNESSGSGRAPRDAAARARQGWSSQRLLGNGEVSDPVIKEKSAFTAQKREKQQKNNGSLKRKKQHFEEDVNTTIHPKSLKTEVDVSVVDVGNPADWVKVNVQKTMDCFEVYALVPGLLREEVRVQSDPAGRLVISGDPEQPENPWGVTPFKKVINLPSRIDPQQTSAVVTLHGQLFVRAPLDQAKP
ncbi:hypothetical protein MLD38_030800 [Melastoma candidum]|uniref:Uncharacterized protein n=1 Tax=Melastoma candidum TaxID=119954 RepID=A0ACB9MN99_9MYRT|nr:hypothetical protein MLD38_030800 [Melastoma candidum]